MVKSGVYSVKTNYKYLKQRKQVLQNKPVAFRPTNKIKQFLELKIETGKNRSKIINDAIELSMKNPLDLLNEYCLKYPLIWRRVNRRNGQFIKQKLNDK